MSELIVLVMGDDPTAASATADLIRQVLVDRQVTVTRGEYLRDVGLKVTLPHRVFLDIHVMKGPS